MEESELLQVFYDIVKNDAAKVLPEPAVASNGRIPARRAIYFHPIHNSEEMTQKKKLIGFQPLYAHHFFGVKEEFVGFQELLVQVFYSISTLDVYIKITGLKDDGMPICPLDADRIYANFQKVPFPGGMCIDENEFFRSLVEKGKSVWNPPVPDDPTFTFTLEKPVADFSAKKSTIKSGGNSSPHFQVKQHPKHEVSTWEFSFRDNPTMSEIRLEFLHRRLEWFLHFFIDACSNIDRDKRWKILIVFLSYDVAPPPPQEKKLPPTKRTKLEEGPAVATPKEAIRLYEPIGLVTLYHFFAIPQCRHRVSQFMVLPHMQRQKIGLRLLQWVSSRAIANPHVGELTVEDPAHSFQRLRDAVGLRLCLLSGVVSPSDLFETGTVLPPSVDQSLEMSRKIYRERFPTLSEAHEGNVATSVSRISTTSTETHALGDEVQDDLLAIPPGTTPEEIVGSPRIREKLQTAIKESKQELNRLLDLLALAKILAESGEVITNESQLRAIRVRVKRRMRLERLEEFEDTAENVVQEKLAVLWERRLRGYKTVLRSTRHSLRNHQALSF